MWTKPTPHETALAQIDDYLKTHSFTMKELWSINKFFGNSKRAYGIRTLRMTAAINKIRAMDGKPPIPVLVQV